MEQDEDEDEDEQESQPFLPDENKPEGGRAEQWRAPVSGPELWTVR